MSNSQCLFKTAAEAKAPVVTPLSVAFNSILSHCIPSASREVFTLLSLFSVIYCRETQALLFSGEDFNPQRPIGKGAHGEVLLYQSASKRTLAIKKPSDIGFLTSSEKEEMHWNTVYPTQKSFLFVDIYSNSLLIMPFLGDAVLNKLLAAAPSAEIQLRLYIAAAQALQHLHQNNIAHRDISGDNICFQLNENKLDAFIIDFGLSAKIDKEYPAKDDVVEFCRMIISNYYILPYQPLRFFVFLNVVLQTVQASNWQASTLFQIILAALKFELAYETNNLNESLVLIQEVLATPQLEKFHPEFHEAALDAKRTLLDNNTRKAFINEANAGRLTITFPSSRVKKKMDTLFASITQYSPTKTS